MYKVASRWDHQNSIHVEWNLGKRCNLDCSYCPAEIHDNFSKHTNFGILMNAVDALVELDKPVRISLTGGEPCVHPNITELVEYAGRQVEWINITTNGTLPAHKYDSIPVNHYVFSLHVEDEKWERSIQNVLNFSEYKSVPFHVNLMAHHDLMDRVKHAAALFKANNVPYVVRRIRWTEKHDSFDDLKYKIQDLDWILDQTATAKANCIVDDTNFMHANDIIKEHKNQFKGWSCAAGVESLMINWDGEVHRATCRVGGSLGNIYTGSFEQPKEWITCTRNWCTCAADIPLTKVQPELDQVIVLL